MVFRSVRARLALLQKQDRLTRPAKQATEGGRGHGQTGSADGRDTIARSFLEVRGNRGDRPADPRKKFASGSDQLREWLQNLQDIASACMQAASARDVASIIANAVPEWVYADMGILAPAAVSSGIYPTDSSSQVEYLINDSSTKVIFAEDEEQLDKILSCRSRCPTLQKIIVFDMEG